MPRGRGRGGGGAPWDSLAVREFVGSGNDVPDATTLLRFRHMVEEELDRRIEGSIRDRLGSRGPLMHGGPCVDATIVEAPGSTKAASGGRDPEMRQTKKGGRWRFGVRCHAATGAGTGHVAAEALAAVSVSDARGAHGLVRGDGRAPARGAREGERGGPCGARPPHPQAGPRMLGGALPGDPC
ncbi:transposase [Olsenella sp. Marseille-P4559]|uniref:transposase n=1 Tax=Olsenella sp. Marseille-P4559 TaxID=2364795 RepID=UPI0010319960|nr:transposase [Olsenella sp. Marseille-P4559]